LVVTRFSGQVRLSRRGGSAARASPGGQTPAGEVKPTGAKIDFPTADFWYLRNGKVEVFDCHIAFTTLFAQLGILPDYAAAVAASAPGGN
jgi:hypothetical protein